MRVIAVYNIDGSEVVCMDAVDFLGPLVTPKEGQRIQLGTVCGAAADRWQVGDEGAIFGHEANSEVEVSKQGEKVDKTVENLMVGRLGR